MKNPTTLPKAIVVIVFGLILIVTIVEYSKKHKVDKDFVTVHNVDSLHSQIRP